MTLSASDQSTGMGAGLFEGPSNNFNTAANPFTLNVISNTTEATDAGGQLGFGGKYSNNSVAMFAGGAPTSNASNAARTVGS